MERIERNKLHHITMVEVNSDHLRMSEKLLFFSYCFFHKKVTVFSISYSTSQGAQSNSPEVAVLRFAKS